MSTMGDQGDARTTKRTPFEALVEVADGAAEGEPFEAQAVNVSEEGMAMRTAYLPDVGQALVCRFDSGKDSVTAQGEVVWQKAEPCGGEFGVRFTGLDADSEKALEKLVKPQDLAAPKGRVRLHIEGLASPMRAKVKGTSKNELTVGSELGFLQVGKQLELEDTETGDKRPAIIDRVEVEIDPESHIPRLVVALKYGDDDAAEEAAADEAQASAEADADEPKVVIAEEPSVESDADVAAAQSMKGAFARNAAKVTPAVMGFLKTVRARAAEELAKRRKTEDDGKAKRTTAPAPGGGLHASGRKVVRSGSEAEIPLAKKLKLDKRRVALGAAAGLALVLVVAALHKSPSTPPAAPVASAEPASPAASSAPSLPTDPMLANTSTPLAVPTVVMPMQPELDPSPSKPGDKPAKVAPFANGTVTHGNVLRLKMDGAIEHINGAPQPTGFSVSIPGHKSLEPAGPLAARDSRIASIRVSNDAGGALLDVAFKDGVPNYLVRAKGDTLEIVLAPIATASHDVTPPKHGAAPTAKKPGAAPAAGDKKPHGKH